jgi:hypothetical protein
VATEAGFLISILSLSRSKSRVMPLMDLSLSVAGTEEVLQVNAELTPTKCMKGLTK